MSVTGDDREALRAIKAMRTALRREVPKATAKTGAITVTTVRALASTGTHPPGHGHIPGTGPGPNVATGDYRRSINVVVVKAAGITVADVSTNAVQANRLEFGFIGLDSRGRYYRQPPFPHWAPAQAVVQTYADGFFEDAAATIQEAFDHG